MRLIPFIILLLAIRIDAQVSINTTGSTAYVSAKLDVASSGKGVLIPRMTTVERDSISAPATGLMIYNSTTGKFNYYSGATWIEMFAGSLHNIVDADGDTHLTCW